MSVFAGLSLREVYVKRCRDLHCKPNSILRQSLPTTPDDFESTHHLDLSRNFIGPRGILPLLDVVQCCRQLRSIDLRAQMLEHDSVEAICCAVRRHPTLVRLNLSKNPINIASGGLLLDLAKSNRTLEFILLEETSVKEAMTTAIEKQLAENRAAKGVKAEAHKQALAALSGSRHATSARERMAPQAVQTCLSYFGSSVCNLLFDENPLHVLTAYCREHNNWFHDVQFSAADEATQRAATGHYSIGGWTRLAELYPKAKLFPTDITPDGASTTYDLPVMSLPGFQWLFTSIAAAAPTTSHLRQMLLSEEAEQPTFRAETSCGVYVLRVFIDGAWRYVVVDDFVPVDRSGQPIFSPAVEGGGGEMYIWSCLIEKAFAKLHGGYQAIDSDLVRSDAEAKLRHSKPGRPEPTTLDPMMADRHTCPFKTMADLSGGIGLMQPLHTDTFRAEAWWPVMYQMLSHRHTTSRHGSKLDQSASSILRGTAPSAAHIVQTGRSQGGSSENEVNRPLPSITPGTAALPPMAVAVSRESAKTLPGIHPHHAYQLIQVVQINGFFLVELANVCDGRTTMARWRGEWSEESPLWTRYPEVDCALRSTHSHSLASASGHGARDGDNSSDNHKVLLGHSSSGRSSFWMSYTDFLKAFEELHCARSFPGTACGLVEGSWGRRTAGGPLSSDTWYTNPHYRMSVSERATAFISLSLPDRRFTSSDVTAIGFHWVKDELYPIYDPHTCGGPQTDANRFLYRAKYVRSDSICFETTLDADEDYWFVPSTLAAGQMHRFYVRVFSSIPFVMTQEALDQHWSVVTLTDEVLSSGAFRSGDDNAQMAFRLDDLTRSMHSSCAASLSVCSASLKRSSQLSRTTRSHIMNSVIGSVSADSYRRGGGSSVASGFFIARAVVTPSVKSMTSTVKGKLNGASAVSVENTDAATTAAGGKVSVGLFMAFADENPAGELSRTVGMLTDDNCVAASPYVLGNRVYCEGPAAAGEAYTLICCVQPIETRAKVEFTLFTTIPTCKLALLPMWPKQSVEVQWSRSGSYYEADNQPQIEIFPARAGARFVVHMSMSDYSCAQATITLSVVNNHGRCGMYVPGKISQEKLLVRSEYVRDNWVQCAVEIGESDVDSIIAIPCLQPTGSRGTCVVTVSSDTTGFSIRTLQGSLQRRGSTKGSTG